MVLHPPVEPMLAQARDTLPGPGALPGGLAYEIKFDGYRALLFTPVAEAGPVLLQLRRGSLVQARFPELVRAAECLPRGLVLDGELVVWAGEQLSFEALQRRAASSGATAKRLAQVLPAHFIVFDVLQSDGQELLRVPYMDRRAQLESLFATSSLAAPWTLCPMTTDGVTAREWLTSWTEVPGVEGLVIKGLEQRYAPGVRGWYKIRRRHTTEAIVGGVTGSLRRPQSVLLGRYDDEGVLRPVGRSTPVRPATARQMGELLTPAGPGHPWEGVRFTASWGSRDPLHVTLVDPSLVAEIEVDTAQDRGAWRHPVRLARVRSDTAPGDVPRFGEGASPAAG